MQTTATHNTQLLPVFFLRKNFGEYRKALWIYSILRQNGIGRAGYTTDHISFLKSYGIASSTAYRYVAKLRGMGWLVDSKSGVRIKSVHKIGGSNNKYCIAIPTSMLHSYEVFSNFIFSSLLLSKFQADFKSRCRNKSIGLEQVSNEVYRSYDLWTATTTEQVGAAYLGISQPSFHRLKKSSSKKGFLKTRYALDKKNNFKSKEEALNYLAMCSEYSRIQKVGDYYFIVVGSTICINSILSINKYSSNKKAHATPQLPV